MNTQLSQKENLLYRTLLALTIIALAAASAHRSASMELHASRRDGPVLRRDHQRPPPRFLLSSPRALCRRHFHWLSTN